MNAVPTTLVGFDSAWVDNPKKPGAICAIQLRSDGAKAFVEPQLASFSAALSFIERERAQAEVCLVAIDQPTIVPNLTGCRPVDRVAGSLISWLGGGVQPASRSRTGMFDDAAPIWRFKQQLDAIEDPERARLSASGLFLIEVFPALAIATFAEAHFGRKLGARYNPHRRKTFKIEHWRNVLAGVARFAAAESIPKINEWANDAAAHDLPRKADQDKLDAVICALVAYQWLSKSRIDSIMIGDLVSGYMIAPANAEVRDRLVASAIARGVAVDGVK